MTTWPCQWNLFLVKHLYYVPPCWMARWHISKTNGQMNTDQNVLYFWFVIEIITCRVSHSVIWPIQNWSGCGHLITAGFLASFIVCYVSFLLCPSLHHFSPPPHPQTSLIKKQRFLVIKAVGHPDTISPSFCLIALWEGREGVRGKRGEECLQQ